MSSCMVTLMVYTRCRPEDESRFNSWYNEVHIPMILKSGKVQGVVRYKAVNVPLDQSPYIAMYRFANQKDMEDFSQSPELKAAVEEMAQTWADRVEVTSRVLCELVKEW